MAFVSSSPNPRGYVHAPGRAPMHRTVLWEQLLSGTCSPEPLWAHPGARDTGMQWRLTREVPGSPLPERTCGCGRGPREEVGGRLREAWLQERHSEQTSEEQPGVDIRGVRGKGLMGH